MPRVHSPKNFKYTEVKREGVNVPETNDCMVCAASVAMEIPYKDSHALFELAGRRNRCGTYIPQARKAFGFAKELGLPVVEAVNLRDDGDGYGGLIPANALRRSDEEREVIYTTRHGYSSSRYLPRYKAVTLAMLKDVLKSGRFIICNHNHAWAVVDGIAYDGRYRNGRTEITNLFKVEVL
jgi:hypothetical protein